MGRTLNAPEHGGAHDHDEHVEHALGVVDGHDVAVARGGERGDGPVQRGHVLGLRERERWERVRERKRERERERERQRWERDGQGQRRTLVNVSREASVSTRMYVGSGLGPGQGLIEPSYGLLQ